MGEYSDFENSIWNGYSLKPLLVESSVPRPRMPEGCHRAQMTNEAGAHRQTITYESDGRDNTKAMESSVPRPESAASVPEFLNETKSI